MENLITKEMVVKGYNQGLINLITSPIGDGICCSIGDNWFYFGGSTAEEYNDVTKYEKDMWVEDIINDIYTVLEEFKTENIDEYLYYHSYLSFELSKIERISKRELILKISKEANLSEYDMNLLQHDINNLRGQEWDAFVKKYCSKETYKTFKETIGIKTKRLHISMAYTYVGDTGIDVPLELLEGKTEEEQYKIAFQYAQEHIGEIPVARNAEYVADSDNFEIDDIKWEEE
jgi:hypothetical protein